MRFDVFAGVDRAVIHYANSVAVRRDIDDVGFQELASALSNDQLVELAVIVG